MSLRRLFSIAILLLIAGLILPSESAAQDRKISRKDIPPAVLSAFAQSYPHAKIRGTSTEVENGNTYYEIESVDGAQRRDILYRADGTAAEIEEVVSPRALPESVNNAIAREFGKSEISKAERVRKGAALSYEVHVKLGGKSGSIVVSDSGRVLEKSPLKAKKEKKEKEENEEEEDD